MTSDPADLTPAETDPVPGTPVAPDDPDELRAQIRQTREQLGDTVDELAAKADVKARARDKATEVSGEVKAKASQVAESGAAAAKGQPGQIALIGASAVFAYLAVRFWRRR